MAGNFDHINHWTRASLSLLLFGKSRICPWFATGFFLCGAVAQAVTAISARLAALHNR